MVSEVFWEMLEAFSLKMDDLLCSLRVDLLHHSAVHYALYIFGQGDLLEHCVEFLDYTKIFILRPAGPAFNRKACYSGRIRSYCLVYLTNTIPDGLILYMYGPEEVRRHEMTISSKSNLDENMQVALVIEREKLYIYGNYRFIMRPWMPIGYAQSLARPYESL